MMINVENYGTPRRPTVEVCIEGVQRPSGAVRLGILVNGLDCRKRQRG